MRHHLIGWSTNVLIVSSAWSAGFSIFSSGGHFVQPSTTTLAYLLEGHPRNISMKLLENWSIGLGAFGWLVVLG